MQHPNIVQVYEVGEHEGKPFFSLEFCGGGSLEKKLNGTPLPAREAAALVETLARAMQAAHEQHVIHRDLKPANVLLAEDGTPKITDFGLAKKLDEAGQTQSGAIMGTPSYMAPEQAGGKSGEIGPAADVYALGAILYECLTGRPPFKAATALDTILQVVSDEPVPPSQLQTKTPRDLETICLKCLHKEARKRYATARELADDLRRFLDGEPIRARPVGRVERAAKWVKRNPVVAALVALVVLSVLGGASGIFVKYLDAKEQEGIAKEQRRQREQEALSDRDAALKQANAMRRRHARRRRSRKARDAGGGTRTGDTISAGHQQRVAGAGGVGQQQCGGGAGASGGGAAGVAPVGMALSDPPVPGRHFYAVRPYRRRYERGVQPGWDAAGDGECAIRRRGCGMRGRASFSWNQGPYRRRYERGVQPGWDAAGDGE